MATDQIIIVNVETGEVVERSMTPEEKAQRDQDAIDAAKAEADRKAKADARAAALAKLGLTADEITALFG